MTISSFCKKIAIVLSLSTTALTSMALDQHKAAGEYRIELIRQTQQLKHSSVMDKDSAMRNQLTQRIEQTKQLITQLSQSTTAVEAQRLHAQITQLLGQASKDSSFTGVVSGYDKSKDATVEKGQASERSKASSRTAVKLAPVADDLLPSVAVQSTHPDIIAKAAELNNSPAAIYHWVKNNIDYIPSHDSIQGALGTLDSRVGNDTDTASLLIALLRASNVPARYIRANVTINTAQLIEMLGGALNTEQALSLLTQGDIPFETIITGGEISGVIIQRTWVEAWVNMLPSAGTFNDQGSNADDANKTWVGLDGAYKTYDYQAGLDLVGSLSNQSSSLATQVNNNVTLGADGLEGINVADLQAISAALADDIRALLNSGTNMAEAFGQSTLNNPSARLLPASLPYSAVDNPIRSSNLNAHHQMGFVLHANTNGTDQLLSFADDLPAIATEHLSIRSVAASADDLLALQNVLANNSSLDTLPKGLESFNIQVKLQLWAADQLIGESPAMTLGTQTYASLTHTDTSGQFTTQRFIITAGEQRVMTWNLQGGMCQRLEKLTTRILQAHNDLANTDASELIELSLLASNYSYWAASDVYNQWLGAMNKITRYRNISFASSYSWLEVEQAFGLPVRADIRGLAHLSYDRELMAYSDDANDLLRYQEQSNRLTAHLSGFLNGYIHPGEVLTVPHIHTLSLLTDNPLIATSDAADVANFSALDADLIDYINSQIVADYQLTINQDAQSLGVQNNAQWQGHGVLLDNSNAATGQAFISGGITDIDNHSSAVATDHGAALFWQAFSNVSLVGLFSDSFMQAQSLLQGLLVLCADPLSITITDGLMELIAPTILVALIESNLDPVIGREIWPILSIVPTVSLAPILDPEPPVISLNVNPLNITLGESSTISISASDNDAVASLILSIDDIDVPAGSIINDQYVFTPDRGGRYVVKAMASDAAGNVSRTTQTLIVNDPNDNQAPEVDIISPADGSIITGMTDIAIRVEDANLSYWRLSYRNAKDDPTVTPRTTLTEGSAPIDAAVVMAWDTSLLRNGAYVLVLEAIDTNGQVNNTSVAVFLEGGFKIGHFQIAFEDLSIPVAGIPVTITRSYDSRDRNSDRDFGKGWSIGHQSLELTETRVPGLGWFQQVEFFSIGGLGVPFPRYCITSISDRLVSVRLPDGTLEKFKVKAQVGNPSEGRGDCQDFIPPDLFSIAFEPQGDTNSQLTSNDYAGGLRVTDGNLQTLTGGEPIDPDRYTLTLLDGTQYKIDQGFDLTAIETIDGNSIQFTENGIEHNNGYAVQYIRDAEGRIAFIQKPNGERIAYTYDANGDLASHTDLNGNTTTFKYLFDHYLEDIMDPRGIMVARNEYDADGRLVAHIDADGNRIEYTHDIQGRTETIKDRNGNSSIYVYDNSGNVIAQTNALGETTLYEYNDYYLETKRTDPLGNVTTYTYDQFSNQLTETDPLGNTTTSTYNERGEILTQTDADGVVVLDNEYYPSTSNFTRQLRTVKDAFGNATEFNWRRGQDADQNFVVVNTGYTDALGNTMTVEPITSNSFTNNLTGSSTDLNGLKTETIYDDDAQPLTEKQIITDENGDVIAEYITTYEYNPNGDVIKVTDAKGNITRTEYNAINKMSASIDANGNRTEYEYDDRGNQSKITYADGTFETMDYDANNNVIATTDRAGRITRNVYDAADRLIETIKPDDTPLDDTDNPRVVNGYDNAGRLVSVTDANGNTTRYEYDKAGRRTKTIDALGQETVFVYDNRGRRVQSTDALGRITNFEYDDRGNLIKTIFANGTFNTTTYDSLNRKISETDLAGQVTNYEYDAAGNLIAVVDALNQRTEYGYDQRANKVSQTDANGNTTSWAYDELSRMVSRTLPEGQVETYTYDGVGNMISKTDFNGDLTTYTYNNLNQQVKTDFADMTSIVTTYNDVQLMETITEVNGITSYQYDEENRLTRIDYPTGNYIEYQYDKQGNRTQMKTASHTVDYTFDVLNRMQSVTDSNGTTTYTYDAVGNRATQSNANGTVVTYMYDQLNRLVDLTHTDSNNTVIASYAYTLGANGNRLSITEATGRVVDYQYDDTYRLLTETVTDPINGDHSSEWAYDAVGNRLQQLKDGVITTYVYDNNDQIQSETENGMIISYTYDANGNTLSKQINGTVDSNYVYSKQNRMLQATTPSGTIINTYDAAGIRQSQSVNGTMTHYLVDKNRPYAQVIEEQNDLFIPQTTYTYGDDLINQTNNQGTHTFGYDGLGSTRILTDATGTVQNAYGYEAFGEVDYQLGSLENNYLFTGQQYDNNVGFYYLRARYYNPTNGRFTQMDTFPGMQFEPKSLHKYLYTHADPINNIDPSGFAAIAYTSLSSQLLNLMRYASVRLFSSITIPKKRLVTLAINIVFGGIAGYQLYTILSGLPRSLARTAEESEDDGRARAQIQTDALVDNPKGGVKGRRAVIGENQLGRVVPAALALKAITIVFDKNNTFEPPLSPKEQLLSIAYNIGWIKTIKLNGFEIFDIGRDPARKGEPISPWYAAELATLRGYPKHFRIKWPF